MYGKTKMKTSHSLIYTSILLITGCSTLLDNDVKRVPLSGIIDNSIAKPSEVLPNKSDVSLAKVEAKQEIPQSVKSVQPAKPTNNSISVKSSGLKNIIDSALAYNLQTSPLPLTVQQKEAESEAIRKGNWPVIQPTARWNNSSDPYAGLDFSYTLLDFGAGSQREKQGDLAIDASRIDLHLEQREIVADVLAELAAIAALKDKVLLTSNSLKALSELSQYAAIRVAAGFINESEPLLLDLRIAELHSELDAMNVEIALKVKLLSAKLLEPIVDKDVPTFGMMNAALVELLGNDSLQMKKAKLAVDIAQAKLKQTERERFPQINVEGGIGITKNNSENHTVGLVVQSPSSIFAGGANVRAAEAALRAAQQEANQTQVKLETEWERITLERERLVKNRQTLKQLEQTSEHSLILFKSQFEAATATVSDGLTAHRTLLQTRQQLVDLEAELLNLKASEIRISDSQFLKP